MKYSSLLLFFLIMSASLFSQSEFAPKGAEWVYEFQGFRFFSGFSWSERGIERITYERDSLIQNEVTKVLSWKRIFYASNYPDSLQVEEKELLLSQRNDSIFINNLLYFYLNAKVGDTLECCVCCPRTGLNVEKKVFIDSVGQFNLDTFSFKSWTGRSYSETLTAGPAYSHFPLTFVDRLGPINDFFLYYGFRGTSHNSALISESNPNHGVKLRCYQDDELGQINFAGIACDSITPFPPKDTSDPSAVKRPPSLSTAKGNIWYGDYGNIYFKFSEPVSRVDVFSIDGKLLYSNPSRHSEGFFQLSSSVLGGMIITKAAFSDGTIQINKIFIPK